MIFSVRFFDRKIIDAREPQTHQAIVVVFPIFVAVRPIPVARVVVPLVSKPNGNAISGESPKLFDQPIVELLCPLTGKEGDDFLCGRHKFGAVSPSGIHRVTLRNRLWVA